MTVVRPANAFFVGSAPLEREWGTELVFAESDDWSGKVLTMLAGTRGGYQFHVAKRECFYLASGEAVVELGLDGVLQEFPMRAGDTVFVPAGARHRVTAVTDCVFFEVGDTSPDDRVHAEHEIGEEPTGGLPSTWVSDDGETYRRA